MSVRHVVVAAGPVGHGKSALIRGLTGTEPDRQARESDAGTTAGQCLGWLALPSAAQLAFVEVPGDERFLGRMMAGAGPAPAVVFVLAADAGWVPQSAEQLALVDALDIRHGLLVVTKTDRADPVPVITQAKARIARSSLGDVPAVAVSAATRAGIPELVAALDLLCAGLPAPDPGGAVRLWIERSFRGISPRAGTAGGSGGSDALVTGTLPAGTIHKDDELLITPAMRPVRVLRFESLGQQAEAVTGTARVGVHLRGVGPDLLHRGMALVQPGRWTLTDTIDVRLSAPRSTGAAGVWLPGQRAAAPPGRLARSVSLHVGSARVTARVRPLGPGLVRLSLADPLPLHVGDQVLLRDLATGRAMSWPAVARATVLDVAAPPLARRGAAAAAARQLAMWPDRPTAAHLLARHGLLRGSALLAMGVSDLPAPVTGEWLADPERWRALGQQLGEVLASHAAAESLAVGVPVEAARAALDLPDRRLVAALARPPFRISAGAVHIVPAAQQAQQAGPHLPEAVLAAVRVLRGDLLRAPFVSPDVYRLRKLGLDSRSIEAAVRGGELMRISDHVVLAPGADMAAARILATLEQPFTAAQAREALATTRRTVIPLLEFLDSAAITERLADDRRIVRAAIRAQLAAAGSPSLVVGEPSR